MQMNGNAERLQKSFAELTELQLVLERAGGFFNDQQFRSRGTFEAGSASGAFTSPHLCSKVKIILLASLAQVWSVVGSKLCSIALH